MAAPTKPTMRMLLKIGDISKVDAFVKDLFANKVKIAGFGHRVYHTEDPRATHLRRMSKEACERAGQPKWFEMSARIEETRQSREEAQSQCRLLLGQHVLRERNADRSVHAVLCCEPNVRLDSPHSGTVFEQPLDPPARRIHWSRSPDQKWVPVGQR